jgi:hypothetical protein
LHKTAYRFICSSLVKKVMKLLNYKNRCFYIASSHFLVHSSFIIYHRVYRDTRLTLRPPWLVEQELVTFPQHLGSPQVFIRMRVARSLVFCVVFCRSLFVLCPFSFVIVLSVLLRFTDSDYLPLVLSNSSSHLSQRFYQHSSAADAKTTQTRRRCS